MPLRSCVYTTHGCKAFHDCQWRVVVRPFMTASKPGTLITLSRTLCSKYILHEPVAKAMATAYRVRTGSYLNRAEKVGRELYDV